MQLGTDPNRDGYADGQKECQIDYRLGFVGDHSKTVILFLQPLIFVIHVPGYLSPFSLHHHVLASREAVLSHRVFVALKSWSFSPSQFIATFQAMNGENPESNVLNHQISGEPSFQTNRICAGNMQGYLNLWGLWGN